jgi:hypothetical protein
MKSFSIAAALLVVSFSAMADGATYQYPQVSTSTLTRAEVQAQTAVAAARGQLVGGESSYVAADRAPSQSRSEVRAELATARAKNELAHGEFAFAAQSQATRG